MSQDPVNISVATSSAGQGPVTAAQNLAKGLIRASGGAAKVSIIDLPAKTGPLADLLVNRLYNASLRHALRWNRVGVSLAFRLYRRRTGRIAARVASGTEVFGPPLPDAVVFTTPWLLEPALARLGSVLPTWAVVLDLGPPLSPGWGDSGLDHLLLPTKEAWEGLGRRGTVVGVPVFPPSEANPKVSPCDRCDGAPAALLMGGREGLPGILPLARALSATENIHVTVLAGKNERVLRTLERISSHSRVHLVVKPFVADVLSLISAHDVIVTKPGTLTISEAVVRGKPLLLDACPGLMPQEVGNARFVEAHRAGLMISVPSQAANALKELTENAEFRTGARELASMAGTKRIAEEILRAL